MNFFITEWRLVLDSDWEKSPDNTFQGILVQKFPEDLCNINYNAFHLVQCLSTDIELIDIFLIEAKHLYI